MDAVLTGLFAQPPGAGVALSDFLIRLLIAGLAGQALGWFYARSHGILSYSQNLVQSLVMLSMVVCVIMGVVGDSLARAFGLAAALAIVRFRTPIKDTRDTTFLFLSVAVGMAAGAGQLAIALTATALIGATAIFLHWTAFGSRSTEQGMLRFMLLDGEASRDQVHQVLRKHCRSFRLAASRLAGADGPEELVYDLNLKRELDGDKLVRELTSTGLVQGVSLLPAARSGES
ncbi:MAG: DUF4956 domain-containing protein [Deltaproteobacteria bacterium]|nr:MAG: DUF4956 domain-containing protein [Deltaproteobacteria bacterium]